MVAMTEDDERDLALPTRRERMMRGEGTISVETTPDRLAWLFDAMGITAFGCGLTGHIITAPETVCGCGAVRVDDDGRRVPA